MILTKNDFLVKIIAVMNAIPFDLPKLPPDVDVYGLIPLIVSANSAVARYDEAQKRLISPEIIVMPMASLEAQRSSSIEGTQATFDDFLIGENDPDQDTAKGRDIKEIKNYREAILRSKSLLQQKPLSENVIKELNRILLDSVRGANKTPGEFRQHQVYIGRPGSKIDEASYIPPVYTAIPGLFSNFVSYIQDDNQQDRLVQAAIMHYQFEAIHPFSDGNGRTGRLLVPVYLYEKGVTSEPNMYISEFIDKYRRDYYDALRDVSNKGDWLPWIEFFLTGLREQAKALKDRIDQINNLYDRYHRGVDRFGSKYAPTFLDAIFSKPVFTAGTISHITKITNMQAIRSLIGKFEKLGALNELNGSKRNKQYKFTELVNIVEGLSDK